MLEIQQVYLLQNDTRGISDDPTRGHVDQARETSTIHSSLHKRERKRPQARLAGRRVCALMPNQKCNVASLQSAEVERPGSISLNLNAKLRFDGLQTGESFDQTPAARGLPLVRADLPVSRPDDTEGAIDPASRSCADGQAVRPLFELHATAVAAHWRLPVSPRMCVGSGDKKFMFGGIGIGAALVAVERFCERPVVWAAAQFFAHAAPGRIVELRIEIPANSKATTQARITASCEDSDIYFVSAALSSRDHPLSRQWAEPPAVPSPDRLADGLQWPAGSGELSQHIEVRPVPTARLDVRDGSRRALWMRSRHGLPLDAGLLSIYADFVTLGIETALGPHWKASSLDNTLRVLRIVPTDWVLCDIRIQGVHAGIVQGDMHMFTPDGDLLAVASQSMLLRDDRKS